MVCSRCKMVVRGEFDKIGLSPVSVELGEIEIKTEPNESQIKKLSESLKHFGFELIDDKKSRIIEKIKNSLVKLIHEDKSISNTNLSAFLADKLNYEYSYLSSLFSEVDGTTIEKFFINLRVERIKELLVYDELTLSEIADLLGYSSSAYLSTQFKQITGLTPSFYKKLKDHKRKNIEEL